MYYGIDSDTAVFPSGANSHDFYIGRLGKGTTSDTSYFNYAGAGLATHKYMYWLLYGPKNDTGYTSASTYTTNLGVSWGKEQAENAYIAWLHEANVDMYTIFCDVENPSGCGWLTSSDSSNYKNLNYAVFEGFCDTVNSLGSCESGVYTSSGSWQYIMGTSLSPGYANTVWGANWPSGSTFNNPPGSMAGVKVVNGVAPTVWQYYGATRSHDASKTGDANIASYLPA